MQECLAYFGKLTLAQQQKAGNSFHGRFKTETGDPSALLTRIMIDVQIVDSCSLRGMTGITPSAESPSWPGLPKKSVIAQRFSLFLDNFSPVSSAPCLSSQGDIYSCHIVTRSPQ